MIRVLHIMGCSDAGGISSVVLNYYRFLDRSRFRFDIALTVPTVGQNGHALEALGAEIYFLPLKSQGLKAFREGLEALLREGQYDAVHVHESETCYVALSVARKLGIPCRIAHAHTSSPYEGIKGELRRLSGCVLNYHYATHVIGCGKLAGDRVFGRRHMKGKKALILPNAVDSRAFAFDPALRQEVRRELNVEDKLVFGMVGRLSEEKNPGFGIELMPLLRRRLPNAVLVMAGNGPEEEKLAGKIRELGLEDAVRLLGRRSDVARLCQGFDLFLLPSFHEGFPVAAVEALASGLPVLLSDTVTRELEGFSAVRYLPLSRQEAWVEAAEAWQTDPHRSGRCREVAREGLDLSGCARLLEAVYEQDTGKACKGE